MAICPHTGLTVPECSCDRCLEEQIRRFRPALLEPEAPGPAAASAAGAPRRRRWRRAA